MNLAAHDSGCADDSYGSRRGHLAERASRVAETLHLDHPARWAALLGGVGLALGGARRSAWEGVVAGLAGGVLAHWGLAGVCPWYRDLGAPASRRAGHAVEGESARGALPIAEAGDRSTGDARRARFRPRRAAATWGPGGWSDGVRAKDVVQEASEESFPASDAPGWTGAKS